MVKVIVSKKNWILIQMARNLLGGIGYAFEVKHRLECGGTGWEREGETGEWSG
jgi:hypothetical protein